SARQRVGSARPRVRHGCGDSSRAARTLHSGSCGGGCCRELRAAGRGGRSLETVAEDALPQFDAALLVLLLVRFLDFGGVDMDAVPEVAVGRLCFLGIRTPSVPEVHT